jgi:hypothetical protein
MTPDQIRWLTWGAIQHRPPGAPRWDEPGTHKAIADHCGTWGLDIATEHVLAHARDEKARTPFAIKGPQPHTEPSAGPRFPAGKGQECELHKGEWAGGCRACAADKLAADDEARTPARPHAAAPPTDTYRAAKTALNGADHEH